MAGFTLIDGELATRRPAVPASPPAIQLEAEIDGDSVRVAPAALRDALGWELKPQGLCRGETCVPVRDRAALVVGAGIDLAAFARALDRPLALDVPERAAALAASAAERTSRLASLEAPDFALPDLGGRLHRLSEQRGKKVLLIAYASW
jgi:hypothetical protein